MYNQKIFFEHIYVDEAHCEVNIIVTKSKLYKQFLCINKFFMINIFFKQSFKAM